MSQINANAILDASGGTTASINGYTPSASNMAGRNRIINGDMRIDQRNAGAAVTTHGQFVTDRWNSAQTNGSASGISVQQSTTVPSSAGFTNSLSYSVTTGGSVGTTGSYGIQQRIEGYNFADILSGSANAKQFTLSFWVRSSVTGSYGIALRNSARDRSYIATYSVSAANTWEQKSITVTADTSGTWLTTNGIGLDIFFDLGVGSSSSTTADSWQAGNYTGLTSGVKLVETNGATFYITGVQLEVGSTASEFEHRLYGQELALCQRYWYAHKCNSSEFIDFYHSASGYMMQTIPFPVEMRAQPSLTFDSSTNWVTANLSSFVVQVRNTTSALYQLRVSTTGRGYAYYNANDNRQIQFSAEL